MARPPRRPGGARTRLAALLLAVGACGNGAANCATVPCPPPLAAVITVTGGTVGATVPGASIAVTGRVVGQLPCAQEECHLYGGPGAYDLAVTAPGYQSVHRQLVVTGTSPVCGCETADTQRLTIVLQGVP